MGAKGAAIATVIAVMFTVLIYTYFLLKDEIRVKYGVLKTNLSSKMMRRQFEIGYPQALSEIMLMFAFGIFYKIIGIIGTVELAASHVILNIAHASFMPAVGIGMAVRSKFRIFADSFESAATKISTVLFIIIIIGALVSEWNTFINNLSSLGPAMILLMVIMITIGYNSSKWFRMKNQQAVTVAIESGIQNGTVGITIGNIILNPDTGLSILSIPSGVYSILMYFICLPFVFWYIKNIDK